MCGLKHLCADRKTAVLSWLNFEDKNPAAASSNFGPVGEYDGVCGQTHENPRRRIVFVSSSFFDFMCFSDTPWLTDEQAAAFYPSNYSGPGWPEHIPPAAVAGHE